MGRNNKDILLDDDGDLKIENGDFVLGRSFWQEVKIILSLSPGNLKSDPILGPALNAKIRGTKGKLNIINRIKKALKRDGKDFESIKGQISEWLRK